MLRFLSGFASVVHVTRKLTITNKTEQLVNR